MIDGRHSILEILQFGQFDDLLDPGTTVANFILVGLEPGNFAASTRQKSEMKSVFPDCAQCGLGYHLRYSLCYRASLYLEYADKSTDKQTLHRNIY
uniref:Protein kinase domain-containing protein n=1 Tax=Ascaris lumbricoides TaxID=6252 RepID=A0A0M3IGG4_ASCLU